MRLFSPAKINLFLRIVSKRPDGYHQLSSVFQAISLGDTLTIDLHDRDELTCSDPHLPRDDSNLVLKATRLFRKKTGYERGFRIHLEKRIPTQAGLGGGSSNAATTLWACAKLANPDIPLNTLKDWGAEIGSDVPFFFSQGTAYCAGRGEIVHHLPSLTQKTVWIVKPAGGLSTPSVYKQLNFGDAVSEKVVRRDLDGFLAGSMSYFNDLEAPAFSLRSDLRALKEVLLEGGFEVVLMSGSGSAFFCLGEGRLPEQEDVEIFPASFISRPLNEWYSESTFSEL